MNNIAATYEQRKKLRAKYGTANPLAIMERYEEMRLLLKEAQSEDTEAFEERLTTMMTEGWGSSLTEQDKQAARSLVVVIE